MELVDDFEQVDAIIRRTYGIDPSALADEKWIQLYAEYKYTEKIKYENRVLAFKHALIEVFNQAFGNE